MNNYYAIEPNVKLRKLYSGIAFSSAYLILLILVIAYFPPELKIQGIAFIVANFVISSAFITLHNSALFWPFFTVVHTVFFLVYICKAVILLILGLGSRYITSSVLVHATPSDYLLALEHVTVGNFVILLTSLFFSLAPWKMQSNLGRKEYLSNLFVTRLLALILLWILASSLIMYAFGVAIMGTGGVSLPFKLSGIFFYSRTICIPLVLIYVVEKSIVEKDSRLFGIAITTYLILAVSEILVRSSKSPLLIMLVFLSFLYFMLWLRGISVAFVLKKKVLILLLLCAIFLFPIIDIYRAVIVSGQDMSMLLTRAGSYLDNPYLQSSSFSTVGLERLFHRLVGFTQFLGLVSDGEVAHQFRDVLRYGSFAEYYTKYYLGTDIVGHSSSPSLLGSLYILGKSEWSLYFLIYIVLMGQLWRSTLFFSNLELVLKCFLCYELFNTIMAGTVSSSILRIAMLITVAIFVEIVIAAKLSKKTSLKGAVT